MLLLYYIFVVFFFKQKTAYEMRISDWSSDVCSSDLTQAIEIHPGALAQYPHRDQDMWQGPKGEVEYLLNVIWPLSPFTAENGATRLWPHSHRPDAAPMPDEEPIAIELKRGSGPTGGAPWRERVCQ